MNISPRITNRLVDSRLRIEMSEVLPEYIILASRATLADYIPRIENQTSLQIPLSHVISCIRSTTPFLGRTVEKAPGSGQIRIGANSAVSLAYSNPGDYLRPLVEELKDPASGSQLPATLDAVLAWLLAEDRSVLETSLLYHSVASVSDPADPTTLTNVPIYKGVLFPYSLLIVPGVISVKKDSDEPVPVISTTTELRSASDLISLFSPIISVSSRSAGNSLNNTIKRFK